MRHITKVLGIELTPYEEGQLVFTMRYGAGLITHIEYDAEGIRFMEVTFCYGNGFIVDYTDSHRYMDNGMPSYEHTGRIDLHEILVPYKNLSEIAKKWTDFKEALYKWRSSFYVVKRNAGALMEEFHIKKENQEDTKKEDLTNPSYYNVEGASQPIEDMEALMTPEQFEGFLWGNIIKYSKRFGRKGDKILTLGKIIWYANRLKTHLEKESDVNGHD